MPQPVKSHGVWNGVKERGGNLFTDRAAGVIQTAGRISGLGYIGGAVVGAVTEGAMGLVAAGVGTFIDLW